MESNGKYGQSIENRELPSTTRRKDVESWGLFPHSGEKPKDKDGIEGEERLSLSVCRDESSNSRRNSRVAIGFAMN